MTGASTITAELNVSERVLLFCVALWAKVGVSNSTATATISILSSSVIPSGASF
jgi:hypothetical protein